MEQAEATKEPSSQASPAIGTNSGTSSGTSSGAHRALPLPVAAVPLPEHLKAAHMQVATSTCSFSLKRATLHSSSFGFANDVLFFFFSFFFFLGQDCCRRYEEILI